MKCKYGNENMYLIKEECLWHCPHCGYFQFAPRTFYNQMKVEAPKHDNKKEFVEMWAESVWGIVASAWDKVHSSG